MNRPSARPIRKLLVANRGEIAVRILAAARDLGIETYALYTENDRSHTYNSAHIIKLSSPSSYSDITQLIAIVNEHGIDAVHPGYGFLSESVDFAKRVSKETGAVVVGPGAEILTQTADKLQARRLAENCGVPILPALLTPTDDIKHVFKFAQDVGYPIMIKAVDGGGGRGIRLVNEEEGLSHLMARAVQESPSNQVFAEKAAVKGFRHIEVQIVGDLHGNVINVFERDCSVQRRYQKVVEMAPSLIADRRLIAEITDSAMEMAKKIRYVSFGTFEFLANPRTGEYFFLEVNPRLQVEHTVTESIAMVDLVQAQLRIAQGATIWEAGLSISTQLEARPPLHSLQLRVTAEDVAKDWSLSIGKIQSFHFPSGNGIRVDTHLVHGIPAIIGADFDSLIAKIVVTASTWLDVVAKARRALEDTMIIGIHTNLHMLQAIVRHKDFVAGECDTSWLEQNHTPLLNSAKVLSQETASSPLFDSTPSTTNTSALAPTSLIRKGDAWTLSLQPKTETPRSPPQPHHLSITSVLRNDFPTTFSAEIALTPPSSISGPTSSKSQAYILHLNSTTASASATTSKHRRGSPKDPTHIIVPFSGKLVEVCVDIGDVVKKGDVVCVVKQMKMELEVRAPKAGVVAWITEAEDGEDVGEGMLAAVVEDETVGAKL